MPQDFHVLQCFECRTFQVDIVKKVPKWICKMCGAKQSLTHVFSKGGGKECRIFVQSLNEQRLKNQIVNPDQDYDLAVAPREQISILKSAEYSKWNEFSENQISEELQNELSNNSSSKSVQQDPSGNLMNLRLKNQVFTPEQDYAFAASPEEQIPTLKSPGSSKWDQFSVGLQNEVCNNNNASGKFIQPGPANNLTISRYNNLEDGYFEEPCCDLDSILEL